MEAYIYDAVRTVRGKGNRKGALMGVTPTELAKQVLVAIKEHNLGLDTSKVEDVISIFACKGTADSPLSISNNLIVGSYDYNPVANKSYSGSGIQVESGSQFCKIEGNVVVQAGNTALALSWVSDSVVKDNVVVNTGFLEDGSMVAQVWRGLLLGNPGWPQGEAGTKRNVASGNYIQYPQNIEDGSQRWGDSIHVAAGNSSTDKAITTPATKADEQKAIDDLITSLQRQRDILRETDPVQKEMIRNRKVLATATNVPSPRLEGDVWVPGTDVCAQIVEVELASRMWAFGPGEGEEAVHELLQAVELLQGIVEEADPLLGWHRFIVVQQLGGAAQGR